LDFLLKIMIFSNPVVQASNSETKRTELTDVPIFSSEDWGSAGLGRWLHDMSALG